MIAFLALLGHGLKNLGLYPAAFVPPVPLPLLLAQKTAAHVCPALQVTTTGLKAAPCAAPAPLGVIAPMLVS